MENYPVRFINTWKEMAGLDDFLSAQTDKAIFRIRKRFEQKQEQFPRSAEVLEFHLGVVAKKKWVTDATGTTTSYVWLKFGLLGSSAIMDEDKYSKAAALLHEAIRENATSQPRLESVKIQFRRTRLN